MSYPATADPVHWAFYLSRNDIVRANELERGIYDPFYIRCIICCIIPNIIFFIFYRKMREFEYTKELIVKLSNKIKRRRN